MAARKNRLGKSLITSVLILFLLVGVISVTFNLVSSSGGNTGNIDNSDTTTPEEEVLPDGIRLNKTELIF